VLSTIAAVSDQLAELFFNRHFLHFVSSKECREIHEFRAHGIQVVHSAVTRLELKLKMVFTFGHALDENAGFIFQVFGMVDPILRLAAISATVRPPRSNQDVTQNLSLTGRSAFASLTCAPLTKAVGQWRIPAGTKNEYD